MKSGRACALLKASRKSRSGREEGVMLQTASLFISRDAVCNISGLDGVELMVSSRGSVRAPSGSERGGALVMTAVLGL